MVIAQERRGIHGIANPAKRQGWFRAGCNTVSKKRHHARQEKRIWITDVEKGPGNEAKERESRV